MKFKRLGEKNGNSKLSEKDVREILVSLKNAARVSYLAKVYKVSDFTIRSIKNRWTWTHIKIPSQ